MKLPNLPSFNCFSGSSITGKRAEPFDELNLSDAQVARNVAKLQKKGYFSIPVSQQTDQFLKNQRKENGVDLGLRNLHTTTFISNEFERNTTATANKIVSAATKQQMRLKPHEFEVRWPGGGGADSWHMDKRPNMLTCIKTIDGPGTKFVSPRTADKHFKRPDMSSSSFNPVAGEASVQDKIRQMKQNKFYFFFGRGIAKSRDTEAGPPRSRR